MHNNKVIRSKVRAFFLPLLALCFALIAAGQTQAAPGGPVYVTLGKAELIHVAGNVADVLVADPSVVDVMAVKSNRLYVVGLNIGDTNLIALDENGNMLKRVDIHVKYDLQAIQDVVNELYPNEQAQVRSVHDQILLTGSVSTPEVASKITNLVAHYISDLQDEKASVDELLSNLLEVRGEQQVMLQVRIMEASRSLFKELGVETNANDPNELATSTVFGSTRSSSSNSRGSFGFGTGAGLALSGDAVGMASLIADTGLRGIGDIGLFLNALEEEDLVNTLAEPNLTTVSGEQAGFLAGGEFPVPVGRDNVGNIVVEFREFGVSLNFRPVVMSDERISLNLNTEVSSLDFGSGIVLADLTVPGLDIRRAETTVEMASGSSLMIAGLLQSDSVKGMAGLPGVRNTPVLGDLVKSDSFKRDETELVIIVTPYLVEPYKETKRAERLPKTQHNPLALAFAKNMRRLYAVDPGVFPEDQRYGYILN